jgi:ABC-2 type transport system permease protein
MGIFFRLIRGDFKKLRRSSIVWIHVAVPILIALLFVWYYSSSTLNDISKVQYFIQALSIGFPLIIGIVCAMIVEQEAYAGNFQELLMSKNKLLSFFSKICMLTFMAAASLIMAVGILAIGLEFLLHKTPFSAIFYGKIILLLLFCEIFLYLLHLLCSFKFGTGASVGLGISESLIAALMLTGLGDKIWKWIPCSWGGKACDYYIFLNTYKDNSETYMQEFQSTLYIFAVVTMIFLLISFLWFNYFEGRKEN